MCGSLEGWNKPYVAGQLWLGTDPNTIKLEPHGDHLGELQAWDLSTGKEVWNHHFKNELFASALSTGGNLVFVGGTPDRKFRAFDGKTGDVLWEQTTNSGIIGMPSSYEVDGTQYIAVQSGWGVDGARIDQSLKKANWMATDDTPQGGVVWVFGLKK
jgi:alcohol dehydrogenase (cytochrome c)